MKKNYSITSEKKMQYAGIYLLQYMINTPRYFPLLLNENDSDLEPIIEWLLKKEYIIIENNNRYIPTNTGRLILKLFMSRYTDYLKVFDIYCAVDLESGEFAFEKYFDFSNDESWYDYLNKNRWEDLRLAVCEFKKLDPVEIVFMSFLNENRFGQDKTGWQFDLLLGSVWDEILHIANTALYINDLAYEDEEGTVSGELVIKDIITQGANCNVELKKKEKELFKDDDEEDDEDLDDTQEYIVDPVIIEEYPMNSYYAYRDPFYVSPVWLALWLL